MNERIEKGMEMIAFQQDIKQVMEQIIHRTLKMRERKEHYFMPFIPMDGVSFEGPLSFLNIDLNSIYPQAEIGDRVFVEFLIRTQTEEEIYLNIKGSGTVWFEGEQKEESPHIPIKVMCDKPNKVRIRCVKTEENFGVGILLSVRRYPWIWATDYLCNLRAVSPIEELAGEDGVAISRLYGSEEEAADITYEFPKVRNISAFEFDELFEDGEVAYVYTVVDQDHIMKLKGTVDRVWVNGVLWEGKPEAVETRKEDIVLIECRRKDGSWNLSLSEEQISLPFLRSHRNVGDKAVCLGGFSSAALPPIDFPVDFTRVPKDAAGKDTYWKFADGSELRIYLDSIFYGQWFYALMVGFYGIRRAGEVLEKEEYTAYFYENMKTLAKYHPYVVYDTRKHGSAAFMSRSVDVKDLDGCGTMGMDLIDAYTMKADDSIRELIEELSEMAAQKIPRWPDGTYYRRETMWTDDLYMSCPFLIRLANLTGDDIWNQEVLKQIRGYKQRLYMEDQDLFSHIYFVSENQSNRVPWGRGNGWILWTLTEILEHMEKGREWDEILLIFQKYAKGIEGFQDDSGLWRQVLNSNRSESYLETSCTAMFLLAFARGVKYGWLDSDYIPAIQKAWTGLLTHSIDCDGNIYGVCMGSGCSMDSKYYDTIPTVKNDDHGTGVILAAASELFEMLEQIGGKKG